MSTRCPAEKFVADVEHAAKPETIAARLSTSPFTYAPDNPQREIFARLTLCSDVSTIGLSKWLGVTLAEASRIRNGEQPLSEKQASTLCKCSHNVAFRNGIDALMQAVKP